MSLIHAIVSNPVKVAVGALLVSLFGAIAFTRMPMQLTPEVQTPSISIDTNWPGASPQEVEQEITHEQEEQLKGVEGVTKLSSESQDSRSITLEFRVGTNMEEALLKVNSRLQQVREYPEDALQPVISTTNASDRPIAWFILSSRLPSDESFDSFVKKYPHLAEKILASRKAHNKGLAMLRLRSLAEQHPEIKELLPPSDRQVNQMQRLAEDEIESRFERVAGVSQANVIGGLIDELQVTVDPEKLASRGLTVANVRNVLLAQNTDTSAGDFWEGKRRWVVRALGQFRSPEQVKNQLITVSNNAPVFIRDVATVEFGFKKPTGLVRRFGESTITINCLRETGANVLDVMDGLKKAQAEIDSEVLKPLGLQLTQAYDETDYIQSSIGLVQENIFIGGALTMIVLMCFLHLGFRTLLTIPVIFVTAIAAAYVSPIYFLVCLTVIIVAGFAFARGALVVALAIPISIVATFLVMGLMGRSLNVISLAGLAFAVGMLVDNAIVVLENIFRHHEMGKSPNSASVEGTQEVLGAIIASTITTVAVFLPVVFVQEEAGQLFRDIALAISAAVSLSLLVSMTVIPAAASRLFDNKKHVERVGAAQGQPIIQVERSSHPATPNRSDVSLLSRLLWPFQLANRFSMASIIESNRWLQKGVLRQLAVVLVLVGLSVGITWLLWPKVEYLPTGNRNQVMGILLPPPSYNIDQLKQIGETIEAELRPYWDVDPDSPAAAELDYPVIGDFFFIARGRQVFFGIQAHDPQRAGELVDLIRSVGSGIPGATLVVKQSSLFERGLSAGRTIEIEITGPELPKLVALAGQAMSQVNQMLPGSQVRPVPTLDLSTPEIHIVPKLLQAAEMGVNSRDLGYAANALIDGAYAGDYYLEGKKIDVTLKGMDRYSDSTEKIEALPIATPTGQLIPLSSLADVELATGPEQINHRERMRSITVEVSPPANFPLEIAMSRIRNEVVQPLIESGTLAGGYQVNLAGTADRLSAMKVTFFGRWDGFTMANVISIVTSQFVMVVLITYLLMAGLFESWLYPLVIIFSVPLGAVGGVLGLSLLNFYLVSMGQLPQQLDMLTMLGFVILVGTVVNNPILIVHQSINLMRDEGYSSNAAILESVRTRVRPILMTTLTTVLGLLPLVLFPGAGSELYRGLGSVVLGGLVVSTIFTMLLVPTLFSLTIDFKRTVAGWFSGFRKNVPAAGLESPAPTN